MVEPCGVIKALTSIELSSTTLFIVAAGVTDNVGYLSGKLILGWYRFRANISNTAEDFLELAVSLCPIDHGNRFEMYCPGKEFRLKIIAFFHRKRLAQLSR